MSNPYTKYTLPAEPQPLNRRLYAAAKKPFALLWDGVVWLAGPFWTGLVLSLVASFICTLWVGDSAQGYGFAFFRDVIVVGVFWAFFVGGAFAVIKLFRS